jgi:hypothetical protein
MVTVPACITCNQTKKEDDEYLRDLLALDIENEGHEVAAGVLRGKLVRAAQHGQSRLARDVCLRSRLASVHSPGGLYLGKCPAVPLDHVRANRIFARITCGLYFKLYNKRLPDDTSFEIRRVHPHCKQQAIENMLQLKANQRRFIGDSFECLHTVAMEDNTVTCWLMRFFHIYITVSTNLD